MAQTACQVRPKSWRFLRLYVREMWERWDSDVAGQWPQERFNNIFDFWEWYGVTIEISVILPGRMSDVDVFQVSFQVHLKASKISNSQWKSASLETRSPFNCLQKVWKRDLHLTASKISHPTSYLVGSRMWMFFRSVFRST